jgi:hypothetical protein
MRRLTRGLILIGMVTLGCSQRLPLVPVTGQVTMKGEPLRGAIVVFAPQSTADEVVRVGSAVTDADGRFFLQTNYTPRSSGRGALAGAFKVTVSKSVSGKSLPQAEFQKHLAEHRRHKEDHLLTGGLDDKDDFSVQLVPIRYTSVPTTPLTAEVAAGRANEFKFALD